jgi:RimJ/RimL family protein N-acetyltransferase
MINVKIFDKNPTMVDFIWEQMKSHPEMMDDIMTKERFYQQILDNNSVCLILDDSCFIRFSDIIQNRLAHCHIIRWRMIDDFHWKLRQIIIGVFQLLNLERLIATVPVVCERAIKLVDMLGFVKEGESRNTHLLKGKYYNTTIHGLLREEVEKWEV